MAKFNIDGTVFNTDKAKERWNEDTKWDGRNHISKATGSQWAHETLYQSSKDNFYVVRTSAYQGTLPSARLLSHAEAAAWLLTNNEALPEILESFAESIEE